jgi:peptidoglycan/xylan/chitin deacetylase (PgdA/CDA1 family)
VPSRNERIERKTQLPEQLDPMREVELEGKLKARMFSLGWQFPFARVFSSRRPVTIVYHSIPRRHQVNQFPDISSNGLDARSFEKQVAFLKRNFDPLSPADFDSQRSRFGRIQVLLTFDDGFRNNAEVAAPILRRYRVPALFFVSSRHAMPGRYLWFAYLSNLAQYFKGGGFVFRDKFMDMSPERREATVNELRQTLLGLKPHPGAMYRAIEEELPPLEDFLNETELLDHCAGMSAEQVEELARDPLFSIGIHTVDHPYLTRCDEDELVRQIADNKAWLERICKRKSDAIAYPLGDYDPRVLRCCRELALTRGYAVRPRLSTDYRLELPRLGIYRPSLDYLGFKVQHGNLMRTVDLKVG